MLLIASQAVMLKGRSEDQNDQASLFGSSTMPVRVLQYGPPQA